MTGEAIVENTRVVDGLDAACRLHVIATGQRAAETLGLSVVGKSAQAPIETDVSSLRRLSEVVGALVEEVGRCGGVDCMGRSIDGTRLWVTRDRFEAVERRASRLEAALVEIAHAGALAGNEYDMLVDWQGTAFALTQAARRALDPTDRQ
jgi:hypothetical protein